VAELHVGYVITPSGRVLVQGPYDDRTGFALYDDEQSWPGARECGERDWEPVADDDPRVTPADRERLGWVVERVRTGDAS
jgi:hypothetical protein